MKRGDIYMNLGKLNGRIAEKKIKKGILAKQFGISPQAMRKKLTGATKITVDDAIKFCEILDICEYEKKVEIFLQ